MSSLGVPPLDLSAGCKQKAHVSWGGARRVAGLVGGLFLTAGKVVSLRFFAGLTDAPAICLVRTRFEGDAGNLEPDGPAASGAVAELSG